MANYSCCRKCQFKVKQKKNQNPHLTLNPKHCLFLDVFSLEMLMYWSSWFLTLFLLTFSVEYFLSFTIRHVFHRCHGFMNLSQFIGIFFELLTPKLNTLFYFDYKSDKCSNNNISNLDFLFQHLKIRYPLAITSP